MEMRASEYNFNMDVCEQFLCMCNQMCVRRTGVITTLVTSCLVGLTGSAQISRCQGAWFDTRRGQF